MKILFTGISSFTGLWFARELSRQGHEVWGGITRGGAADYEGLRQQRVRQWTGSVIPGLRFADGAFLEIVNRHGPFDLLCHHGAEVGNYKAPDFDFLEATRQNTGASGPALQALAKAGCRGLVVTGTYFESEEGGVPLEVQGAGSAYGLSKTLTWQILRYQAEAAGLSIGKFVIPITFGPWEDPNRLPSILSAAWKKGETPTLRTPLYVRDHVPVDLIASCYAAFCRQVAEAGPGRPHFCRPSGFVERVDAFAARVAAAFSARAGRELPLAAAAQTEFPEPRSRQNSENVLEGSGWKAEPFWDEYFAYHWK